MLRIKSGELAVVPTEEVINEMGMGGIKVKIVESQKKKNGDSTALQRSEELEVLDIINRKGE